MRAPWILFACTAFALTNSALSQDLEIVSVSSSGERFNAGGSAFSVSDDGEWVVFFSSEPVVPGIDGEDGEVDLFLRDRRSGTTYLVSPDTPGYPFVGLRSISGNGKKVVLAAGEWRQFDVETGATLVASQPPRETGRDLSAQSFDGSKTLDYEGTEDWLGPCHPRFAHAGDYSFATDTFGSFAAIHVTDAACGEWQAMRLYDISANGRLVLLSAQPLVPPLSPFSQYLYDDAASTFTPVSPPNVQSPRARISPDGRYVAYDWPNPGLVAGDTNGVFDVFVYDSLAGTTVRVSVDSAGNEANARSFAVDVTSGGIVAFTSDATNLVPEDTLGQTQGYLHDLQTGETRMVTKDAAGNPAGGLTGLATGGQVLLQGSLRPCDPPNSVYISTPAPLVTQEEPPQAPWASPSSATASAPRQDRVLLHSGEFDHRVVDLRIPGRGIDFVWARRYRSRFGQNTSQGIGWEWSYNIRVERAGQHVRLYDGNGRKDLFYLQPDGTYAADGFFMIGTEDQVDGSFTFQFANGGMWFLARLDGSTAEGKVQAITDRHGNTLTFEYDPSGRLSKVYDTLHHAGNQRDIDIFYNRDGYIQAVEDFAGRRVEYQYYMDGDADGSAGDLKSVTTPTVTRTSNGNDFPAGKTTRYAYTSGFNCDELDHNLLRITDPKGQVFLTNVYGSTEDPSDIEFERVVTQIYGDPGDRIDYVYEALAPTPGTNDPLIRTIVNDRVGNVSTYSYSAGNILTHTREYTGRWAADSPTTSADLDMPPPIQALRDTDPDSYATQYEYNDDYKVTRVVYPNGNETNYTYLYDLDPTASRLERGNLLEVRRRPGTHRPAGDQSEVIENFEYLVGYGGMEFVATHLDGRANLTEHFYDGVPDRIRTEHRISGIEEDFEYNEFGQLKARMSPYSGPGGTGHRRRDEYQYYPESDPNGQYGYLEKVIVDIDDPPAVGNLQLTTRYEYDQVGNVIRVIDPKSHVTDYAVNQLNQVVQVRSREVEDGSGVRHETQIFYDANDNIVQLDVQNVDETGKVLPNSDFTTTYEYDILNYVTRVAQEVDPNKVIVTEYEYDANRNQTLIRYGEATGGDFDDQTVGDQPLNTISTIYDERDLVYRTIRAEDASFPDESITQYDYDRNGNLLTRVVGVDNMDATPRVHTYVYDGYDRAVSMTDPIGNVTEYHYDANGNVGSTETAGIPFGIRLMGDDGSGKNVELTHVDLQYDNMDRVTAELVRFFDDSGNDLPGGQQSGLSITTHGWTDTSQLAFVIDDRGNATLHSYDTATRLGMTTDARGNTVTYSYDANSNVVSTMETETSDLDSQVTESFTTSYVYDNLERRIQTTDHVGNVWHSRYDSRGNVTRTIDSLGYEVVYEYDGLNRLTTTIRDLDGDGPSSSDPRDIVTRQEWDDSSRLCAQIDGNGNRTEYFYDALSRRTLTAFADGSFRAVLEHDVHDNALQLEDGNGSHVVRTYDLLNRVTNKQITPGLDVQDKCPGQGHDCQDVSDETTREVFGYDGHSRVVLAENYRTTAMTEVLANRVTRSYDSLSNVLSETIDIPGIGPQTSTFLHDGVGNQIECRYPGLPGRLMTGEYDPLNRKKRIREGGSQLIAEYDYIGPARVERRAYGNGVVCVYGYDGINNAPDDFGVKQVIRTTHTLYPGGPNENLIDDRSFRWDPMHNKTRHADLLGGGVRSYGYDRIHRLRDSTASSAPYSYDLVGNRGIHGGALSTSGGAQGIRLVEDYNSPQGYVLSDVAIPSGVNPNINEPADRQTNQYTTTPFDRRRYDRNGNLIRCNEHDGGRRSMKYDYRDRMVEHQDHETDVVSQYAYDALGRRISKTVDVNGVAGGPSVTCFYYDGWQVIEEQKTAGQSEARYVYGLYIDEVLQMRRGGTDYYYHTDDIYNVCAVTNGAGTVQERYEYGDFGEVQVLTPGSSPRGQSVIDNPYMFTGRRCDTESGLHYYRTRYMDPRVGRFTSGDRIGAWGDSNNLGNKFSYAGNNPATMLDPLGRQSQTGFPEWSAQWIEEQRTAVDQRVEADGWYYLKPHFNIGGLDIGLLTGELGASKDRKLKERTLKENGDLVDDVVAVGVELGTKPLVKYQSPQVRGNSVDVSFVSTSGVAGVFLGEGNPMKAEGFWGASVSADLASVAVNTFGDWATAEGVLGVGVDAAWVGEALRIKVALGIGGGITVRPFKAYDDLKWAVPEIARDPRQFGADVYESTKDVLIGSSGVRSLGMSERIRERIGHALKYKHEGGKRPVSGRKTRGNAFQRFGEN